MPRVKLSALYEGAIGVFADTAVAQGRSGPVARRRPRPKYRPTPGQAASMERMGQASALWNTLDRAGAERWNAFARLMVKVGFDGIKRYSPTGQNVFCALNSKRLQIDPMAAPLTEPPARRFVSGAGIVALRPADEAPPGMVRLGCDVATPEGELVEVLGYRLMNERASAKGGYVTRAFVRFEGPSSTVDVALEAGWWGIGVRDVCAATGEERSMRTPGVVEVRSRPGEKRAGGPLRPTG